MNPLATTVPPVPASSPSSGIARLEGSLTTARLQAAGVSVVPFDAVLDADEGLTRSDPGVSTVRTLQRFEAMVLSQLISTMMNVSGENILGEGAGMSAYASLFAEALGEKIAERGGIGLAETLAGRIDADPAARTDR